MRNRSPAATEIAAMSRSVPFRDGSPRANPHPAAAPTEIDACLYMFALCKQLQTICLDSRGIDCLVDADRSGRLPEAACRMLGLMVCELVEDAAEYPHPAAAGRTITVTLQRRGPLCLCTISHHGLADRGAWAQPGLQRARRLATELQGSCTVRMMPDRSMIAIGFDAPSVERLVPAAMRRYRASEARRQPFGRRS
jgi:two-component sensor histidine kinase